MSVITLTTDFATSDSYVAQMKGVILSLNPLATIVDISHHVPLCDIRRGAQLLADAAVQFPSGSVHLGVVDPGVGSDRRRIILEAKLSIRGEDKRAYFVGPDNGLFSAAAPRQVLTGAWEIRELSLLPPVDRLTTFDGRDVFAPVAALLAAGRPAMDFGPLLEKTGDDFELVELDEPYRMEKRGKELLGHIVRFDSYGNAITNISWVDLPPEVARIRLELLELDLEMTTHYQQIPSGRAAVLMNSQGYLEIAANQKSAQSMLGLSVGNRILVR